MDRNHQQVREVGNRIAVTHAQWGDLYLATNPPEKAARHYRAALGVRH